MPGLNKFDSKDKKRQRLRNHIAKDLASSKYRQRVVPGKDRHRVESENDDGTYWFEDRYDADETAFD